MKKYHFRLVAFFITFSIPFVALATPPQKGASKDIACFTDSGRYELFQGSYTTFDLKRKETYVSQAVFLLDTQTGEVKRYVNKVDENGRYIETWLPTDLSLVEKRKVSQEGNK
jgi:hypothetical protein